MIYSGKAADKKLAFRPCRGVSFQKSFGFAARSSYHKPDEKSMNCGEKAAALRRDFFRRREEKKADGETRGAASKNMKKWK